MEDQVVVVKKKHTVWKVLAIVFAVAALCFAAAKIYQKYFRKKKDEELEEAEELAELEGVDAEDVEAECDACAEEQTFEVPAEAVIANAEELQDAPAEPTETEN